MTRKHITFYAVFILICCTQHVLAQMYRNKTSELMLSDGVLSTDQWLGIMGTEPAQNYRSFPYTITGAASLTYRHHSSGRLGYGIALVLDNQKGDLSNGPPGWGNNLSENTGYYQRAAYTIAVEGQYSYCRKKNYELYSAIGIGYTNLQVAYHFFDNLKGPPGYYYGSPGSPVPTNPYTGDFSHFNAQLTWTGVRRTIADGRVSFFLETGIGYKGLISMGLSCRFRDKALANTPKPDIILLPDWYPVDSSFQHLCTIRAKPFGDRHAGFHSQLGTITESAGRKRANVFRVTNVCSYSSDTNHCFIKGVAYRVENYDSLKSKVLRTEQDKTKQSDCAYLTIYSTHKRQPDHDVHICPFKAGSFTGDTSYIDITERKNATLKITKEGKYYLGLAK